MSALQQTPLHALHEERGGKMVDFTGYSLPVQYKSGIMAEHLHTRQAASLFDVSHMGQVILSGEGAAAALETQMPSDVLGLSEGRQRYGFFTNSEGGILDDLMFANRGDHLFLVVNAACKRADIARLRAALEPAVKVREVTDRGLLALQGPLAEPVLAAFDPDAAGMRFMDIRTLTLDGVEAWVTRSGYTGEDGYEISLPAGASEAFARRLLEHEAVELAGLGARDSLRLEAGLCLYGNDIDETTRPGEAGLGWAIPRVRRRGGAREGGFPGAEAVLSDLERGPARKRVGLRPEGRAPMREGVPLHADENSDTAVGRITSGGFGPSVGAAIAMGYVPADLASPGTRLYGDLRGRRLPVEVVPLPFVAAGHKR